MNKSEKKFPKSRNRKRRSLSRAERTMYTGLLLGALTMPSCKNNVSESEALAEELYKANKEFRKAEENLKKQEKDVEKAKIRFEKAKTSKSQAEESYNNQ